MNPIFIYLFFNTVGGQWLNGFVAIFTKGFLAWFNTPEFVMALVNSLTVLAREWFLCYYLYLKRIFFKI
jgi:hypothetical protein